MDKYNERDWEEIASYLSGESNKKSGVVNSFLDNKGQEIENYWTMINNNRGVDKVNVDEAWSRLFSRLDEDNLISSKKNTKPMWVQLTRIAAVIIILAATTFTIKLVLTEETSTNLTAVATSITEKNRVVNLSDGSSITLNRDSEISFPEELDGEVRRVELIGEAFFDITPDPSRPFVVDAGKGQVKVLGTSFNVITSNDNREIEVFVETGKVMLSSRDGDRNVTLEPGYIGTLNEGRPESKINDNQNYMSWNSNVLSYDGDRLEQVFEDLKRTHNISVEVRSDSILDHQLTTVFRNNSPETIILSICTSFNLTFEKEGGIYYLSK